MSNGKYELLGNCLACLPAAVTCAHAHNQQKQQQRVLTFHFCEWELIECPSALGKSKSFQAKKKNYSKVNLNYS